MPYTVENGMWRSVFAVPNDIVDLHLKLCGEVPLKVLLALLRYNGGLEAPSLATIVGKPERVVQEAVDYLVGQGILKDASRHAPRLQYTIAEEESEEDAVQAQGKITTITAGRRKFDREEINRIAEADENVTWLLQESQAVLGKTLNAVATDTIVALYSHYGMRPDLIMMVLQYCVSIDKASMGYIEKVAATWRENGIETHEQAEREIQRQTQTRSVENRVKAAFGIYDRSLISKEKKYIQVWTEDFGFDIPLITLAFERTVEVKGKLSFPYINGILTNWHTKGVKMPLEAMKDMNEASAGKAGQKTSAKASSYDLAELEELLNQGAL